MSVPRPTTDPAKPPAAGGLFGCARVPRGIEVRGHGVEFLVTDGALLVTWETAWTGRQRRSVRRADVRAVHVMPDLTSAVSRRMTQVVVELNGGETLAPLRRRPAEESNWLADRLREALGETPPAWAPPVKKARLGLHARRPAPVPAPVQAPPGPTRASTPSPRPAPKSKPAAPHAPPLGARPEVPWVRTSAAALADRARAAVVRSGGAASTAGSGRPPGRSAAPLVFVVPVLFGCLLSGSILAGTYVDRSKPWAVGVYCVTVAVAVAAFVGMCMSMGRVDGPGPRKATEAERIERRRRRRESKTRPGRSREV